MSLLINISGVLRGHYTIDSLYDWNVWFLLWCLSSFLPLYWCYFIVCLWSYAGVWYFYECICFYLTVSESDIIKLFNQSLNVIHKITKLFFIHCSDVIMSMMASQITSVSNLRSNICSGADQRKHQSSTSLAFVRGIYRSKLQVTGFSEGKPQATSGFPSQRASNVENVSIWWWHQVFPVHSCSL